MAQLKLLVTVDGTEHVVGIIPLDYKMFEKAHSITWASVMNDPTVDHSIWIAWHAAKRVGAIPIDMTLETFELALSDMEQVAADPLDRGTSAPSGSKRSAASRRK